MPTLSSIVTVNITRDTKVPTQKGFGTPGILSKESDAIFAVGELVRTYSQETALSSLVADGFTTSSETYKCAAGLTSQSLKGEFLKVVRQGASVAQEDTITIDVVANDTTYTVTVNGVAYEFTSDADATDAEIQAGLIALLDAISGISAVANSTNKIDLSSDNAGKGYSLAVDANMSFVNTAANNGPVEEIIKARDFDDDWYMLFDTTHTNLQAELVADYIESQVKLYSYQTSDATSKDTTESLDTTGILKILKDKAYDRSIGIWVPADELGEYKMARVAGGLLPKDPGSVTWKFKSGAGASANKFTTQEEVNIEGKNGNIYVRVAGINMLQQGIVASGEYIDIMRGTDWIQSRIMENVFGLFTSEDKVPFDDGGIESVGLQVEDILGQAEARTILVVGSSVVTVPKRSETTKADRSNRFLRDVKFTGEYAGAIHKTQIDGTLSV